MHLNNMYLNTFDKYECCGCTACEQVCTKKAISMQPDNEGFSYPLVNKDLCVNCGLCEKVCAFVNPRYDNLSTPKVYATFHKQVEERKRSSSGGLFYAIAQWVISQGGTVFGAAFDDNLQLSHIGVDNLKDLEKLRGSKYLQSAMNGTYKNIKELLKQGCWVYFVGTGCQVAGLKAFLRMDYPKLLTSDLVCHGVPSQKIFNHHIAYLNKSINGTIIEYKFRNNAFWGVNEIYTYRNDKNVKSINTGHFALSPYLFQFMYGYSYRYSCYNCKFAQIPRQGDITLADFWGVKKFFPQIDAKTGVSLVLVNSEKGSVVWNAIKNNCEYYESKIEDGAKYNGNLVKQTKEPEIRKGIYEKIEKEGYEKIAETLFRPHNYRKIKIKQFLTRTSLYKIARRIIKRK